MTRRDTYRIWIISFVAFFAALYLLRGMLLPFVAGLALAYFLDPLADRMERAGMSRTPAVVAIIVGFMLGGVGLLVVLVPMIQVQVVTLIGNAPEYADRIVEIARPHVQWVIDHLPPEQVHALENAAGNYAGGMVSWLGGFAKGVLTRSFAVFSILSLLIITPVVTFYLLRDWDRMVARIDGWLPLHSATTIRGMAAEIDRTLAGFLRGQATMCLILALYYGSGLSIAGLDAGLVVGIGTGLLSFIPYVGGLTGFFVGMCLALVQFTDWPSILGVFAVFCGGQFLEGYVLTPRLVGNKVGLHPVWVLFSLFAGGSLFGLLGILVALPTAAVIGVLVRHSLRRYLTSSLYTGDRDEPAKAHGDE